MNQINVQVLHVEQVYEHCLCTLQVQLRDYMCVQCVCVVYDTKNTK